MENNDLATLIRELSPGDVLVRDELCTDQFCDDLTHELRALVLDRRGDLIRLAKFVNHKQPLGITPLAVDLEITDEGTLIDDTGTVLYISGVIKSENDDLLRLSDAYEEIVLGTATKLYALGVPEHDLALDASYASMRAVANDDRLENTSTQAYAALQLLGIERPTPHQVMSMTVLINTQRGVGVNVGRQLAVPTFGR